MYVCVCAYAYTHRHTHCMISCKKSIRNKNNNTLTHTNKKMILSTAHLAPSNADWAIKKPLLVSRNYTWVSSDTHLVAIDIFVCTQWGCAEYGRLGRLDAKDCDTKEKRQGAQLWVRTNVYLVLNKCSAVSPHKCLFGTKCIFTRRSAVSPHKCLFGTK